MKGRNFYAFLAAGLVVFALAMVFPTKKASAQGDESQFVVASSMLSGLAPGAVFPFIDTTPQTISQAHIAITDATTNCSPGAAPPSNVKVLVGQAGVSLVSVMEASTNRSEEHTSELQSRPHLVCRLLLEKKKKIKLRPSGSECHDVYRTH